MEETEMKKAEAVEEVDTKCHFFIVAPLSLTAVQVSGIILYRNPRGSRNPPKSGKVQKPLVQKPTRTPRTSKNIIKSLVSVLEDNDI